jgi:hypothetical protein
VFLEIKQLKTLGIDGTCRSAWMHDYRIRASKEEKFPLEHTSQLFPLKVTSIIQNFRYFALEINTSQLLN